MLQCISPHLAIDREAFEQQIAQYKRWLFRIRYACTYHHTTLTERVMGFLPKMPRIPLIHEGPDEFDPPPRDPVHAHPDFDFSWGTGALIDSYTPFYRLNGMHVRVPGHEEVEEYDKASKEPKDKWLITRGPTNEYIHPIVYMRSLVRGWDSHSPLRTGWIRDHWRGTDGKERYWWHKDGEKHLCVIPEWAILPHLSDTEYNFERYWYNECEKTKKTADALAKVEAFGTNDFLETLDKHIDFGFDSKPQNLWP